jgi:hypothetical protein
MNDSDPPGRERTSRREPSGPDVGGGLPTRRAVLKAGAVAAGLGAASVAGVRVGARALAQGATPAAGTPTECVLTPELTE